MPEKQRIVLDTNCLLASLSRHSKYYGVWRSFQNGDYTLCVSNEILNEYQEIIGSKTTPEIAKNVIYLLLKSKNVELIDPYFKFSLITSDPDDNKFVDCAVAANATYIVSDDRHFDILKHIPFPVLSVIRLATFLKLLGQAN